MLNKAELRSALLKTRLELPGDEVAAKNALIVDTLKREIVRYEAQSIHYFEPIYKLNEIDVMPLVDFLRTRSSRTVLHTSRKIDGLWRTVTVYGKLVTNEEYYDMVIVPMIGFDLSLHRLGYGGGYYDRLLHRQPKTQKIGVCFEVGKLRHVPHAAHDVPMDAIISEQQIYRTEHLAPS